jgi:DNA-binding Xre family transcriptional regulator
MLVVLHQVQHSCIVHRAMLHVNRLEVFVFVSQSNSPLSPLGERIDAVRKQRNKYSQYRLAKDAQLDYSQLYRILRGKSNPSRQSLLRICRALGCSLQEATEIFDLSPLHAPSQDELEDERPVLAAS